MNKRKLITVLCLMLTLLFATSIAFAIPHPFSEKHIMSGVINDWITDMFSGRNLDDIKNVLYVDFDSVKNGSVTINSEIGRTGTSTGGLVINTSIIPTLYKVFQNLGIMVLIIYFGVGLLEDLSFNQMYQEKLIKKFVFLIIGIVLISNSMDLVYGIANVGSAIVLKAYNLATSKNLMSPTLDTVRAEVWSDIYTVNKDASNIKQMGSNIRDLGVQIGYITQLFIPWLITKMCTVLLQVVCWSRFIELSLMAIVSPVALSDISKAEPNTSNANRAVKNIIALSMTGAIIMLAVIIGTRIQASIFAQAVTSDNFSSLCWQQVIIGIVQVGVCFRANDITKQALGIA